MLVIGPAIPAARSTEATINPNSTIPSDVARSSLARVPEARCYEDSIMDGYTPAVVQPTTAYNHTSYQS